MAETVQSLEGLASLKPAAPEAPKYVQKIDKQGRAYATGKRKNAVARVWIKPGSGKILVNTRAMEVFFARPVLRMMIQQPLVAANRTGQYDVTCTVSGGGLSGQAGAVRHGISKALTYFEPDLRGALKKAASSPATRAWSSARNTATRKPAVPSSSPSARFFEFGNITGRQTEAARLSCTAFNSNFRDFFASNFRKSFFELRATT